MLSSIRKASGFTRRLCVPIAGPCRRLRLLRVHARLLSTRDPYGVLGISPGASEKEIKEAYKKLAMRHHPDRNPGDREGAERRFKEISEAYARLSGGGGSSQQQQQSGGGFPGGGFQGGFRGGFPGGFSQEDADRLFSELFRQAGARPGGGFPGGGGGLGGFTSMQQEVFQGSDGRMRVRITRVGPDGTRTVEETELRAGASPFGFGAGSFGGFPNGFPGTGREGSPSSGGAGGGGSGGGGAGGGGAPVLAAAVESPRSSTRRLHARRCKPKRCSRAWRGRPPAPSPAPLSTRSSRRRGAGWTMPWTGCARSRAWAAAVAAAPGMASRPLQGNGPEVTVVDGE